MRTSKKDLILDAAVGLIEASGMDAVTYEALAEAAGMSKSGMVYHFPSRRDLLLGIHRHLAAEWEREMEAVAGGAAGDVDAATRLRAVVMTLSHAATRAELLLQLDAAAEPEFAAPWDEVDQRWVPPVPSVDAVDAVDAVGPVGTVDTEGTAGAVGSAGSVDQAEAMQARDMAVATYLVQVAADGLWVHDHVHQSLSAAQRSALTEAILRLIP